MKRGIKFLGLVMLGMLLSCGTTTNVFDDTVPLEKSATLYIEPAYRVKSYNDISVQLKSTGMGYTGFTIPAGKTTIVMDLDTGRQFGDDRFYGKNISFTYDFEAGKEYLIRFWFTNEKGEVLTAVVNYSGNPSLIVCQGKDQKAALLVVKLDFAK